MSYDLSKLKLNGTSLGTVDGIKLNGQILTGLLGIKLNNEIVISFSGGGTTGGQYEDAGPGIVTGDSYNFALVSDAQTRLDMNIVDESYESYIPYRGIAGLMRSAAYATQQVIGKDADYATNPAMTGFTLSNTGSFGYPFDVYNFTPSSNAEQHLKEQFDAVRSLEQSIAFISNFEPIISQFVIESGQGQCNDTMATATDENALYDMTGQVGGKYTLANGGYINVFTYNHAALWYEAGMEAATRNWYDSSKGILFVDVEDVYISMFLEGFNSGNGNINTEMLHKTSIDTNSKEALLSLLDDSDVPNYCFNSDVDFGLVVTSIGTGSILGGTFLGGSYGAQLWDIIARTNGMYGLLVDEFPCLQKYSYAKFNTTNQSVAYQFLGPIGISFDPSESSNFANYASTYLHEIFPDFSSIGGSLFEIDTTFNNSGFADFLVSTNTPSETTQTATFESASQDEWYSTFGVTFDAGGCNIITSETIETAENNCSYKGADVPSLSA